MYSEITTKDMFRDEVKKILYPEKSPTLLMLCAAAFIPHPGPGLYGSISIKWTSDFLFTKDFFKY